MLYLQYQLHKIWGEPYKRAPQGVKNPNFDQKRPRIVIICINPPRLGHQNTQSNHKITKLTPNLPSVTLRHRSRSNIFLPNRAWSQWGCYHNVVSKYVSLSYIIQFYDFLANLTSNLTSMSLKNRSRSNLMRLSFRAWS